MNDLVKVLRNLRPDGLDGLELMCLMRLDRRHLAKLWLRRYIVSLADVATNDNHLVYIRVFNLFSS